MFSRPSDKSHNEESISLRTTTFYETSNILK